MPVPGDETVGGGMKFDEHGDEAVAPASPTGLKQDGLVKELAATDIQSVFRGFRWRSRWRSLRGVRGSVRDLAASTVQSVVKAFLRRRSDTPTTKPWKQTAEVREMAALCLQAVYRGHWTRRRTRTLTMSDIDCGITASNSSQASLAATSSVEELLRYSQSEPGEGEEATQASQAEAASTETEAEERSVGVNSAALHDDSPETSPRGACWDGGVGNGGDEVANEEAIEVTEVVVEEEEALSLALSINGPIPNAPAVNGEALVSARLAASVSEDGTSCSLLREYVAVDPVLPGPLEIEPTCAGGGKASSKAPQSRSGPGSGWARGGKGGRAVLLVKMARERKHAVQAAYMHACEVVCHAVSLREAELRIVLHGIQIPLPPPASTQAGAANEGKGTEEVGHAEGGAGWSAKEDGGSEPIFFIPLSTMTATAEALRTACVRLGLGRAVAQGVTNKKADVARRQLLKIIKGAGAVQRLLLETWGQGNSTPICDWTFETVIKLLETLEVPAKALASPTLLRGGSALLLAHTELAADLSIKSTMLRKRLELFQHALRGVDMWEGSGLWPGTLPASPLPPTRLSSHRRLSRSLSTTHPLPPQETDHMGHRRAATLSSPPRASAFVGPEETAGEEEEDTWQCAQSMPLPPLSSEGLERMNLATVKKGNYCIVADTEELCRVFRGAWRAHGFGEHVDSEDGQGSIWLEQVINRLMATQLGGRGGKVLSMRSALPSHSFVRVEVYRPLDPSSSTWVLEPTDGGAACGDTEGHVDVLDLPLRALFHAPAAVIHPHVYTPHVLRVGRRVRVCPADRLQECLDNASHWVDSDAVYRDILSLAGQHAEVICVREACPPLCRVGLRTATGLEDAVPLHALEPLPHPPRRTKAHKRRRTFTVTPSFPKPCPSTAAPTPCLPSPHPTRTPHTRRHSTDATSPQRSPIKHTHRRSSTLPSPPRVHVESSGSVTLAGSRLVPTPPPSPPPLAFPSIPSRLSRLPQRAPPGADLLDLVDAIDNFAHSHTQAYESAPHAYGAGHQQAAYDDSYRQAAYDSVMESSCPPTADEEPSAVALMAVEVRQRQREDYGLKAPQSKDQRQEAERREEEKEEALHSTGYATREHGTREHGTREHGAKDYGTRDQRIRRRSLEAAPLPQQCHRRTVSGPAHGPTLHKPALALSPVKLTFPTPAPCPPSSAPTGPHHRPAPSLTMNKAPLAVKPRPASATRSRRASWGGHTSPGHSRKPSSSSSSGAHAPAPRPRSASDYTSRRPMSASYLHAHEDVDASYLRVRHEDLEGHEPGSLPWRNAGAAEEGHADLASEGMGPARSGSNNDDDCRDADGTQACVNPPQADAEKGGEEQEGTQWSSRWSKLRDRPIARSSPQTPSGPTKADGGGTTDRGRRLRDGKAFVRRRKSSGGQQQPPPQSAAAAVGLVNVTTLADLEELYPPTRGPEVDTKEGEAAEEQFMRPRGEPSTPHTPTPSNGRRRSVTDIGDLQLDEGRRKSLEAKLRSIERQSHARMAKIHKVVERLRASTYAAGL